MYALSHVGFAHCQRGNYATAVATLDECIALAEEKGALYWKEFSLLNRGSVCAAAGQPADAVRIINSGFEVRKSTGTTMWSPLFLSQLAYAHAQLGQPADALNAIGKAIQVLETAKEGWCEAEVRRLAGEVALLLPERDSVRAEACFKLALVAARAQQAKAWELRAATSLAKLWLEQGKHSAARDLLAPVYAWFTEGEDTLDLKRAKALLDGMAPACELRF
jgi:predicted ATPase